MDTLTLHLVQVGLPKYQMSMTLYSILCEGFEYYNNSFCLYIIYIILKGVILNQRHHIQNAYNIRVQIQIRNTVYCSTNSKLQLSEHEMCSIIIHM